MPVALVITAPGINCDLELAEAFRLAGADVERVLLKQLIGDPALIGRFDLIGVPGGFSYGDDIAAGRIMAQLIRGSVFGRLIDAIERGVPIIAPCNGFQIAVQAGLLPGSIDSLSPASSGRAVAAPTPSVALIDNASARFSDRWVRVEIPAETRCIWTRGLRPEGAAALLPIAHGEGRFICDPSTLRALERNGQIALRYGSADNPNGSMGDVAGICDATGRFFGLMPHPERFTRWAQHPFWTRLGDDVTTGMPLGLAMFRTAVALTQAPHPATARSRS